MMRVVQRAASAVTAYSPAATSIVSKVSRFVIVAPGRCGSELLVDLLHSQPNVACDGEMLRERVRLPRMFLEAHAQRARRNGARYYGCKLLVGQLEDVQQLADPARFVTHLGTRG